MGFKYLDINIKIVQCMYSHPHIYHTLPFPRLLHSPSPSSYQSLQKSSWAAKRRTSTAQLTKWLFEDRKFPSIYISDLQTRIKYRPTLLSSYENLKHFQGLEKNVVASVEN